MPCPALATTDTATSQSIHVRMGNAPAAKSRVHPISREGWCGSEAVSRASKNTRVPRYDKFAAKWCIRLFDRVKGSSGATEIRFKMLGRGPSWTKEAHSQKSADPAVLW